MSTSGLHLYFGYLIILFYTWFLACPACHKHALKLCGLSVLIASKTCQEQLGHRIIKCLNYPARFLDRLPIRQLDLQGYSITLTPLPADKFR